MIKNNRHTLIALLILSGISPLIDPQPAFAKGFWDKLGDAATQLDPFNKNSAMRRVLREADPTTSNSTFCRAVTTDGAGFAAEAASSAFGLPGAGTAAVSIFKGTCSKPGGSSLGLPAGANQEAILQELTRQIDIEWSARVKLKELDVEEAKIVNQALVDIEKARQNGETGRLKIQMDALAAMNRAKTEAEIEKARINLEAVIVAENTKLAIATLQEEGKSIRAKLLSDTLQNLENARQKGWTDRVRLETQALIKMNAADNNVALAKAKLEATTNRLRLIENGLSTFSDFLRGHFDLRREKEITRREIRLAEIELEKEIALADRKDDFSMVSLWGRPIVPCTQGVVFISGAQPQTVCVEAKQGLRAGNYKYNPDSNQLVRETSSLTEDPETKLLRSWGWKSVSCSPSTVFISGITNSPVCVLPRPELPRGQYKYDANLNQLRRIRNGG